MKLAALLSLISFFIFLILGAVVYNKNPKAKLNRSFALFSVLLCYYSFTQFMLRNSEIYSAAYFWAVLHKLSLAFITPAFLHVILIYTNRDEHLKRKWLVYSAIYIPAVAASFILSFTQIATTGPIKYPWGYEYGVAQDPRIFMLLTTWALGITGIGAGFLVQNYLKADSSRVRRQAGYMLFGIFLPIAVTTTVLFFPVFNITSPYILPVVLAGVFSIIAWTITKYELFEISPDKAVGKIVSTMNDSLFVLNEKKRISFVNRAAIELLGCQESALLGQTLERVITDVDLLALFEQDGFNDNMVVNDYEAKFRTKENEIVRTLLSSSFVVGADDEISGIVIVARNITEWLEAQERIEHLIYHDFGTGLPNASLLRNLVSHAMGSADRHQKKLALMIIRVGQFKRIRSAYGQDLAEELVGIIAKQFIEVLRREDVIGRVGSDELGVVLVDINEAEDAAKAIKKIQEIISASFFIHDKELHLTANIGVSIFPDDDQDLDALFRNADSATNQAELTRANACQFFTRETNVIINERLKLETSLANGIDRDELVVFYQPQVNITSGQIVGMEALARWRHPQKGIVGAPEFIGIAEESGLITKIDLKILHMACEQSRIWHRKGFRPLVLSVNLSAKSLYANTVGQDIGCCLKTADSGIKALEMEVTETTIMDNISVATAVIKDLHAKGVQVAIDDFGTGYSSLSILREVQFDTLKIDRSFVRDIETDQAAATIIATIASMAQTMNLKVIAEGVETRAQVEFLRTLNCSTVQGFYYSPPLPADQFELLLNKDHLSGRDAA